MLRFADSFDHYAIADILKKWTQVLTLDATTTITTVGRNSTNGLKLNVGAGANNRTNRYFRVIPASGDVAVVGMAFRCVSAFNLLTNSTDEGGGSASGSPLLSIRHAGVSQVWFRLDNTGTISAFRSTTLLGTSSTGLTQNVMHYLEFKVLIDNSAGTVEVKRDGTTILTLSSQDTQQSGTDAWDEFSIGPFCPATNAFEVNYDDLIVMDGSGSYNNDFLGDRRVAAIFPNAVGNSNQSTPSSGGADRYTMVDETSLNNDTDYNTFAAASDKDTYGFQNCPVSGATVSAVVANLVARKTDAGAATMAAVARISGTDYDFGTPAGVPSSYAVQQQIWERSAVDGTTAWTTSVIDAAEFGFKKTA